MSYDILYLLTGMRVIASLLFPRHQLLLERRQGAIVGVEGNNKLAINRISSQKVFYYTEQEIYRL